MRQTLAAFCTAVALTCAGLSVTPATASAAPAADPGPAAPPVQVRTYQFPGLGGGLSHYVDYNSVRDFVGWSELPNGLRHATLWRDSRVVDLAPRSIESYATAIAENGDISLWADFGQGLRHYRWRSGGLTRTTPPKTPAPPVPPVRPPGTVATNEHGDAVVRDAASQRLYLVRAGSSARTEVVVPGVAPATIKGVLLAEDRAVAVSVPGGTVDCEHDVAPPSRFFVWRAGKVSAVPVSDGLARSTTVVLRAWTPAGDLLLQSDYPCFDGQADSVALAVWDGTSTHDLGSAGVREIFVNAQGVVAVHDEADQAPARDRVEVWSHGSLTQVAGPFSDGRGFRLVALGAHGELVVQGSLLEVYRQGAWIPLSAPEGSASEFPDFASLDGHLVTAGAQWRSPDGILSSTDIAWELLSVVVSRTLPSLGASWTTTPTLISPSGRVVAGTATKPYPDDRVHAVVWIDGRITDVTVSAPVADVDEVTDAGDVLGRVGTHTGTVPSRPFRWHRGTLTYLDGPGVLAYNSLGGTVRSTSSGVAFVDPGGASHPITVPGHVVRPTAHFEVNDAGTVAFDVPGATVDCGERKAVATEVWTWHGGRAVRASTNHRLGAQQRVLSLNRRDDLLLAGTDPCAPVTDAPVLRIGLSDDTGVHLLGSEYAVDAGRDDLDDEGDALVVSSSLFANSPLVWAGGRETRLGLRSPFRGPRLGAGGQVVAEVFEVPSPPVWTAGTYVAMPSSGGVDSVATAVSRSGVIAGWRYTRVQLPNGSFEITQVTPTLFTLR
ncbi:hypothetical protein CLV35_2774 [Motilibacter peucedani]|uniref:Uncharacterized protein n=1 Tax=Motilibacter peucedani TaxID=598650 RepID=A0A420XMM7_9ACTN|nr:hypothetical protein [Motilibacter peucedani]RKS72529.1 hypothetical protein CLV35_2774 [Motilibacter peucedani]